MIPAPSSLSGFPHKPISVNNKDSSTFWLCGFFLVVSRGVKRKASPSPALLIHGRDSLNKDRQADMEKGLSTAVPSLLSGYYFIRIINQLVTRDVFSYKRIRAYTQPGNLQFSLCNYTQKPSPSRTTHNLSVDGRMSEEPLKNSKCTEAKT